VTVDPVQQFLDQAYALEDAQEFEQALQLCDSIIESNPALAEAHNLRGLILDELGYKHEALSAFREAVRLEPTFIEAQENVNATESEIKQESTHAKMPLDEKRFSNILVKKRRLIAVLAILATVVVFSGIVLAANALGGQSDQEIIHSVVDDFLGSMANKDVDHALTLFSTRLQRLGMSRVQLANLVNSHDFVLFEGYQEVAIASVKIETIMNTDPNALQGTVAEINGIITYTGGFDGYFKATLEKENGAWKLGGYRISVSEGKYRSKQS